MNLSDLVTKHFKLDEHQKAGMARLKLLTIRDLLWYFPNRYSDIGEIKPIRNLNEGETATVYGTIRNTEIKKGFKTKMIRASAQLVDQTGDTINLVWFNQPYIAKMIHAGSLVEVTGKITAGKNGLLYIANPEFKNVSALPIDSHDTLFNSDETIDRNSFAFPVYPETRYVTSRWIYHAILKIVKSGAISQVIDYLPAETLKKYHLPTLQTALVWIHLPQKKDDADSARKRFAFEEVFFIQLKRGQERAKYRENTSYKIISDEKDVQEFVDRFPFTPTDGQTDAINTILDDIQKDQPMARLLEGDVGSGKTAVAATIAYAAIKNRPAKDGKVQSFGNLQVAYMAPTEILAAQHFENFIQYFTHTGINIGLITGSGCRKFPSKVASAVGTPTWTNISRTQLSKWVANGEIPIVIGTHALIQKSVAFKDLALVIIDEQHRFGALQRARLAKKESSGRPVVPHYLSMTATPIPRTLALTIYGDLDLSILDQMPEGRKPVITEIISPDKRDGAYEAVRAEMKKGHQLYVICARINDPDPDKETALNLKSVESESIRLKKEVFPEYEIGVLHSKMTKEKKESVMEDFTNKEIDILVATSVIEVGVNVPNATIIIIEGAERFGLAQLHQLRGRVIRSNDQAYCYLFADAKTPKTLQRLKSLVTAKNGFELAELDLALRGAGELSGAKQWGISDLGMEAIKNIKMVEAARSEATRITNEDPELHHHPILRDTLEKKHLELHFE